MTYLEEYVRAAQSQRKQRHEKELTHWSNSAPPPAPPPKDYHRALTGQRRQHIIGEAAAVLGSFTFSPFQHEGSLRHGLRSGLCSQGRPWSLADFEANEIVQAALKVIGAARPSWYAGQPEYLIPRENCKRCGCALDDEQIAGNRRYCSSLCEASAKQYKADVDAKIEWLTKINASYHAAKALAEPRECEHCKSSFKTLKPLTRFCSKACAGAARENQYQQRTCQNCGISFIHRSVKNRPGHWCSLACYVEGRAKDLPQYACEECGSAFQPKLERQKFCCQACGQRNSEKRRRAARPPRFDAKPCDCCRTLFHPDRAAGRFCSKACNTKFYKMRRKAA